MEEVKKIVMPSDIRHLMETYILGCIDQLPPEIESQVSRSLPNNFKTNTEWKATLREVFKLNDNLDERLRQLWRFRCEIAASMGAPADPHGFATATLEDAAFAHLWHEPKPLPQIEVAKPITLKAIGFWKGIQGMYPEYPKVQDFVRPYWHKEELERIIAYLRSGHTAKCYKGWSTCRFEGCVEGDPNGTKDLTDTEWGWPEGLTHYVERHAVILPEEFIDTMRANNWKAPPFSPKPFSQINLDYTFWLSWATR